MIPKTDACNLPKGEEKRVLEVVDKLNLVRDEATSLDALCSTLGAMLEKVSSPEATVSNNGKTKSPCKTELGGSLDQIAESLAGTRDFICRLIDRLEL